METLGYIGAIFMGLALGLLGGGGSILAVPILVYLFAIPGAVATYYSLFIVGICATIAVISYARLGSVEFQTALTFFIPSVLGVPLSRRVLLPLLPQHCAVLGLMMTKDLLILVVFGAVMIAAAWSMIRKTPKRIVVRGNLEILHVTSNGIGIGMVMGFVGAGGGFLIVPALVNRLGLPMEKAVGTSLLIIALNSLLGFGVDLASGLFVEWGLITRFLLAALLGIGLGTSLNQKIPSQKLKPAFGWFVLACGTLLIFKQILVMREVG